MTDYLAIPPARETGGGGARSRFEERDQSRARSPRRSTGNRSRSSGPLESDDTAALRRCLAAMGAEIAESGGSLSVRGPARRTRCEPHDARRRRLRDRGALPRSCGRRRAGPLRPDGVRRGCASGPWASSWTRFAAPGRASSTRKSKDAFPLSIDGGSLRPARSRSTRHAPASSSRRFSSPRVAVDGGLAVRASGEVASAPYVGHDDRDSPRPRARRVRGRRRDPRSSRARARGEIRSPRRLLVRCSADRGGRRRRRPNPPHGPAVALGRRGRARPARARIDGSSPSPDRRTASKRRLRGGPRDRSPSAPADFPDAVPALAAVAALADGPSRFDGVGHLRLKESDRIGVARRDPDARPARGRAADGDALVVAGPARPVPARRGSRRIAITAWPWRPQSSRCGFRRSSSRIPRCVSKSYRGFFRDLERLLCALSALGTGTFATIRKQKAT